jgi:hypothetical protein
MQMLRKQSRWLLLQSSHYTEPSHYDNITTPLTPESAIRPRSNKEIVRLLSNCTGLGCNVRPRDTKLMGQKAGG